MVVELRANSLCIFILAPVRQDCVHVVTSVFALVTTLRGGLKDSGDDELLRALDAIDLFPHKTTLSVFSSALSKTSMIVLGWGGDR